MKEDKNTLSRRNNISYQTLAPTLLSKTLRHRDCSPKTDVPTGKKRPPEKLPQIPINNFPSYDEIDETVPNSTQLEIFSLRRQNATLAGKLAAANNKLTAALETLFSERRFLQLWFNEGQAPESWNELLTRIRRLESTIAHIEDRNIGPSPDLELPERWKSKDR